MEVRAGLQAAALLQERLHDLARRARIGRRLEHDEVSLAQVRRERRATALSMYDRSGSRCARERRRDGDEDRVRVADDRGIERRGDRLRLDERPEPLRRDVADVALAAVDRVDDRLDDVDEDDALSGLGEGLREREADVARTDDRDVPAHAREGYRAAAM